MIPFYGVLYLQHNFHPKMRGYTGAQAGPLASLTMGHVPHPLDFQKYFVQFTLELQSLRATLCTNMFRVLFYRLSFVPPCIAHQILATSLPILPGYVLCPCECTIAGWMVDSSEVECTCPVTNESNNNNGLSLCERLINGWPCPLTDRTL